MWLGPVFDPHPHLQIPRMGRVCRRLRTRFRAPRGMTAREAPPDGMRITRGAIRVASSPPPPAAGSFSSHLHSSPLRPDSRASHHLVNSCSAPPSLSVLFSLPTPGERWRAGLRMPAGSCTAAPASAPRARLARVAPSPRTLHARTARRPTAGQTHKPGREGQGGASAGLHVTRPQRRQRRHVGSLLPHPSRVRAPPPRLLASLPHGSE